MFSDKNIILFGLVLDAESNITPMGSLYDALEYFMFIYKHNKDVHLIFNIIKINRYVKDVKIESIKNEIVKIINGKYDISDYSFMGNVHVLNLKDLFFKNKPNIVMTVDLTMPFGFKNFMCRAKEVIIIPEYTTSMYYYKSKKNKVTYFTEMSFCYSDVPYKMKIDFESHKKIDKFDNKLYVNYPKYDAKNRPEVLDFACDIGKELLIKEDRYFYDLHERFDEYVYFQSDRWFDPHPRLFHECKLYNKPYHYKSIGVKDGSYYRYKDSLAENLSDRQLTKDDIIVKMMS